MKNIIVLATTILLASCAAMNRQNVRAAAENPKVINDGYSKQTSDKLTGSADQVVANNNDVTTLDVYLRRLSGVQVTGTGASARVTVRGIGSLYLSNEPIYVLNGMVMNNFSSVYSAVNPTDIRSVTVLKDAATTSIYGSRGSNGVIVISLKSSDDNREKLK
jgi:TonB-dependent starch-binding outer membrane protein SusC